MRDVVWTIIISWIVWKIWSSIKTARASSASFHKEEHHHHHYSNNINKDGVTNVKSSQTKEKKYTNDEGDYVDFEEIKK